MVGIVDFRFRIADGHWKELPQHFFNRQSAIGNENLVFGCEESPIILSLIFPL
jgi:hypothetical protein